MERLKRTTRPGDGALRLINGEAIYAEALRQATTTNFTPAEVHEMGLHQVAEISAEIDRILRGQGYTQGSVGERLNAVGKRQEYADSDAGRAELLAYLNDRVKDMYGRLPQAFVTLPRAPLEIRRVPPEIQDGAANGYYRGAALDGSRPAIYFINLKELATGRNIRCRRLCYHEGVPGHHLQISIAQESKDIPTLRKTRRLLGLFRRLGALCRAARRRAWSLCQRSARPRRLPPKLPVPRRAPRRRYGHPLQALEPRAGDRLHGRTTGYARARSQREVERYCTQIGQACSYKVGHTAWMRARDEAKQRLGAKFDISQFHEVLREGAMPLSILERRIRERTGSIA